MGGAGVVPWPEDGVPSTTELPSQAMTGGALAAGPSSQSPLDAGGALQLPGSARAGTSVAAVVGQLHR